MPEYLSPGVYVEEIEIGPKSIEGVSTSTAAFVGETERGPLTPMLITGLEQYRRVYGSYGWKKADGSNSNSYIRHALEGFFGNGGKRCFVARILGANHGIATWPESADKTKAAQTARDEASRALATAQRAADEARSAAEADSENAGKRREAERAERARAAAASTLEDAEKALSATQAARQGPAFIFSALGPGDWGNRVRVLVARATLSQKDDRLFKLIVEYLKDDKPWLQEIYDNLSPDPGDPNYVEKRINGFSDLITVAQGGAEALPIPDRDAPAAPGEREARNECRLTGGSDGDKIGLEDYKGVPTVGQRTGLNALAEVDEISIVCAPNENDPDLAGLTNELVTHCENLKDRFAVLQAPERPPLIAEHYPPTDSKYAAYYFPWIRIIDGGSGVPRAIPPGGHIAGIYARTDIERGVFKAPANEVVRGALGVGVKLTVGDQDILNPRGVNCIRPFLGRGIRLWGARTVSSDPLWKYVNVRRLFLYLEESIQHGTQWVVFEPNDQRLWARVKQSVADFLTTEWRNGALMGLTAEEAFFVKCDETTMTQNDLDNGRLIVVIGVAPVKPAEFVIFRIAQWTRGSEGTV